MKAFLKRNIVLAVVYLLLIFSCREEHVSMKPKIESFIFSKQDNPSLLSDIVGAIDQDKHTVAVVVPVGADVTSLEPAVEVSKLALYSPEGAKNFSEDVTYTVIAQDGSEVDYTVTVKDTRSILTEIYEANPDNKLSWLINNEDSNIESWSGVVLNASQLLESLSLTISGITTLPESLGSLTSLQKLYAADNQLTTIPSSIGNLKNLKELYLNENQLTGVPSSITELTSLEVLNLGNNQLTSIPSNIDNLTNLSKLYVGANQLNSIPKSVVNLANLKSLAVPYNHLTSLPSDIGKLSNLVGLYAYNNQLTALPTSIGELTHLTDLSLSNNKMTSLPENLAKLSSLTFINVANNNLTPLPQNLCNFILGIDLHALDDGVCP